MTRPVLNDFNNLDIYAKSPQPTHSPWGEVQIARQLTPGIWIINTAGHGGIMLSEQREAAMNPTRRRLFYSGNNTSPFHHTPGCYEEDCEWGAVCLQWPTAFNEAMHQAAKELAEYFSTKAPN